MPFVPRKNPHGFAPPAQSHAFAFSKLNSKRTNKKMIERVNRRFINFTHFEMLHLNGFLSFNLHRQFIGCFQRRFASFRCTNCQLFPHRRALKVSFDFAAAIPRPAIAQEQTDRLILGDFSTETANCVSVNIRNTRSFLWKSYSMSRGSASAGVSSYLLDTPGLLSR